MKKFDYSTIEESDTMSNELESLFQNKCPMILDDIQSGHYKISTVKSPFILADNEFDIAEANNTLEEINVRRIQIGSFTGGAFYIVYEKIGEVDNYIIHGNDEEGYNIFNLI